MELFNRLLESLGGAELRNLHGRDIDGLTCPRIASLASGALLDGEDAETCDRDLFTFLERIDNAVNSCLNCLLGLDLGTAENAVDCFYNACFVHMCLFNADNMAYIIY